MESLFCIMRSDKYNFLKNIIQGKIEDRRNQVRRDLMDILVANFLG